MYGFLYSISLAKIIIVNNLLICHLQIMAKANDYAFNNLNVERKGSKIGFFFGKMVINIGKIFKLEQRQDIQHMYNK